MNLVFHLTSHVSTCIIRRRTIPKEIRWLTCFSVSVRSDNKVKEATTEDDGQQSDCSDKKYTSRCMYHFNIIPPGNSLQSTTLIASEKDYGRGNMQGKQQVILEH